MKWLVTGASGFIGTNLVCHLLEAGHEVVGIDDLSRPGSDENDVFLRTTRSFHVTKLDISGPESTDQLLEVAGRPDVVVHLAGQVSFLRSLEDPLRDFQVNAIGSVNVLEFVRRHAPEAVAIGMSSNKVYGDLASVRVIEEEFRYVAPEFPYGFDEHLPLDFHGPYGCSKGVADQYFLDYGRMFGLRTVSLRQSSVYGPHQHPQSDQGWVAHLLQSAALDEAIQLNGQGKQVRDLLHVRDLCRLLDVIGNTCSAGGYTLNVGGGYRNSLSILELFAVIEREFGRRVTYRTGDVRPSDQRVFISANQRVHDIFGWMPQVSVETGVSELWSSLQK